MPASLVSSVSDLFEDPHVRARENIIARPSPLGGLLHVAGVVPKLSRSPGTVGDLGPLRPGQDNEAVYGERLGLDADALAALSARGVI